MTLLLSLLAGIAGAAVGWAAAAALTIFLGGVLGVSDFEGGRGMLAVWGIGPIGGLVGLIAGIVLVLRKRGGYSAGGIAWRVPAVIAAVIAIAAGALWFFYETRPVLNTNGPAPQLAFEVRLPPGLAPSPGIKAEMHTEKNKMPASLSRETPRIEDGRSIVAGTVEMYYRSGWRLLEVRVPGQDDRIFHIGLPASPRRSTDFGRWERAQFVAAPGLSQPRKADATEPFEIRYRVIWAE
jgi:MFS family permease